MVMTTPELIKLNSHEFSQIEPLALYYEYDMSRYCGHLPGWEFPLTGNYASNALMQNLKSYFKQEDKYPFLIRFEGHPAGFVMVNKLGTSPFVEWNMGEFFVLAPYQRRHIGQAIAQRIFSEFTGEWEVAVIPQNKGAYLFWKPLISTLTAGKFSEQKKLLTFPEEHQMIVFSFETKKEQM